MPFLLLLGSALAYETDQLTARLAPLKDAAEAADAEMDRILAEAAASVNATTGCRRRDGVTRRRLAYEVYRLATPEEPIEDREKLAKFGHGSYAAFLETSPRVDRRTFLDRSDIYGDVPPADSLVLGIAGVASTVRLGGVLMGTDKVDHFLEQGFQYFLVSGFGKNDTRAVRFGTRTEMSGYGLLTSKAFSWADLYANWQGYQFYKTLLADGSVFARDDEGCVVRTRNWRWAEWLDDAADEAINPPVYTPKVEEAVRQRLQHHRDAVCADYATWGPAAAARRAEIVAREQAHVSPEAPPRVDPWGLDALCATDAP